MGANRCRCAYGNRSITTILLFYERRPRSLELAGMSSSTTPEYRSLAARTEGLIHFFPWKCVLNLIYGCCRTRLAPRCGDVSSSSMIVMGRSPNARSDSSCYPWAKLIRGAIKKNGRWPARQCRVLNWSSVGRQRLFSTVPALESGVRSLRNRLSRFSEVVLETAEKLVRKSFSVVVNARVGHFHLPLSGIIRGEGA